MPPAGEHAIVQRAEERNSGAGRAPTADFRQMRVDWVFIAREILRFLAVCVPSRGSLCGYLQSPEPELSNGGVVARFRLDLALFRAYIRLCIETNLIRIWPHVP